MRRTRPWDEVGKYPGPSHLRSLEIWMGSMVDLRDKDFSRKI